MDKLDYNQIVFSAIFAFLFLISWAIFLFIFAARKKILSKEIEKINLELSYKEQLVSKILLAQEDERQRIARDLHDEIGSKLVAIHLNLHSLKSLKKKQEERDIIINELIEINKNISEQSRLLAHNLLPPVLEKFGLEAAIRDIQTDYNNSKMVNICSNCDPMINNLDKSKQLQVFRIINELITNSIKHGKASKIDIDILIKEMSLFFKYSDNGKGFDLNNKTKKGMGQLNIESRLNMLNANFEIQSRPNFGFEMTFISKL